MREVIIATDGSYLPKEKRGGWGAILIDTQTGREKEIQGMIIEGGTTSQRMEVMAAYQGLKELKFACQVTLVSDSLYVVRAVNGSYYKWIERKKKSIAHLDLWTEIAKLLSFHQVDAKWVKAHTRNTDTYSVLNRRVDALAQGV